MVRRELAGGLYGVSLGAAFFGESMFHRKTDASKVALVHLAARLAAGGFTLLDAQFVTAHLETFGAPSKFRATPIGFGLPRPWRIAAISGSGRRACSVSGAQALAALSPASKSVA